MKVEKIEICGFRGLLAPFTINMKDGRSALIYGRNGTGKSSITDAWEWLFYGDVEHLKREGAGYSSYPHCEATDGDTYVKLSFGDYTDTLDDIILQYNHDKISKPSVVGNRDSFLESVPHPCHLRFQDLTDFVYYTKRQKYDSLARLMGLNDQVELQKSLRRVERKLKGKLDSVNEEKENNLSTLLKHIDEDKIDDEIIIDKINFLLEKWDFEKIDSLEDLKEQIEIYRGIVENDPLAKEYSKLLELYKRINALNFNDNLIEFMGDLCSHYILYFDKEIDISRIMSIELYEQGKSIIEEKDNYKDRNVCPLCNGNYPGDLIEHIENELDKLHELQETISQLKKKREKVVNALPSDDRLKVNINDINDIIKDADLGIEYSDFLDIINDIALQSNQLKETLGIEVNDFSIQLFKKTEKVQENLGKLINKFNNDKKNIISTINNKVEEYKSNDIRKQFVADYDWLRDFCTYRRKYSIINQKYNQVKKIYQNYCKIVEDYIDSTNSNIQVKFDKISNNVAKYFNLIEKWTEGIKDPIIKLLTSQERSVVLEIDFYGNRTSPAYRYLSESQLNSFGLAIFLASVRSFNENFKFIILDDIVNSLDAYKRPRIIDLIKKEFSDFQFLILTHDDFWYKQLIENFPRWEKIRFNRYVFGSGPVVEKGKSELEEVRNLALDDKALRAGQVLGPLMERQIQFISELFNVRVTYNRRNEYTLRPLVQYLRTRVKNKLTTNHELYKKLDNLETNIVFRNFCSHWKESPSSITLEEVLDTLNLWEEILNLITCEHCYRIVVYNSNNSFKCSCGETELNKQQAHTYSTN